MDSKQALQKVWNKYKELTGEKDDILLLVITPCYNYEDDNEPEKTYTVLKKTIRYLRENPSAIVSFVRSSKSQYIKFDEQADKYFDSDFIIVKIIDDYTSTPHVYVYISKKL